jgi:hypothetical protein
MAKFAYIFKASTTEVDREESRKNWGAWMDKLGEVVRGGDPLGGGKVVEAPDKVSNFEWQDDDVSGYMIIEVADLDAAVELSKDCPAFGEGGHVEVREILAM